MDKEGSGGKMVRNYKRKTEDRWTKEDLLNALMCIKNNELKINDAARTFGISRATLYRQYAKFIQGGAKCDVNQFRTCGGNPILTKVEEDVLEKTITDLRAQGFTVGSTDIKRICFEYCDSNGIPNQFNSEKRTASDDWYYGFLKRHPSVGRVKSSTNADGTPDDLVLKPKMKRRPSKPKPKGDNPPATRSPNNTASPGKKKGKGVKRPRKIKIEQEGETVVFENLEDIAKAEYVLSDNSPNDDDTPAMLLGHINPDDEGNGEAAEEVENDDASEEEHAENGIGGESGYEESESIGIDNEEDDQEETDDVENGLPTFEENEIEENGEVEDDEGEESAEEDEEAEENEEGSETGLANEEEGEENEDDDEDEAENEDDAEEEVENDDEAVGEVENEEESVGEPENEEESAGEVENDDEAEEEVEDEDEVEAEEEVDGEVENEEVDDEDADEIENEDDDEEENEEAEELENEDESVDNGRDIHDEETQKIEDDEDELEDPEEEETEEIKPKVENVKEDTKKKRNRRAQVEKPKPVEEVMEPKRVTPSRSRKRPARYESLSRSSTPTLPTPKGRSRRSAPILAEMEKVNGEPRAKRRRSRKNFS